MFKENQTIQDVHDEYHPLTHKTYKPAHRSVLATSYKAKL